MADGWCCRGSTICGLSDEGILLSSFRWTGLYRGCSAFNGIGVFCITRVLCTGSKSRDERSPS